jgi:hypothetical protein
MQVTVRYLRSCEPELDRWMDSLPGNDPERRALARMHLALVDQWMIDHDGVPPDAERVPRLSPPVYWWEFFPGWWMRIAVRDRRRWFRRVGRDVVVLGLQDEPPGGPSLAM